MDLLQTEVACSLPPGSCHSRPAVPGRFQNRTPNSRRLVLRHSCRGTTVIPRTDGYGALIAMLGPVACAGSRRCTGRWSRSILWAMDCCVAVIWQLATMRLLSRRRIPGSLSWTYLRAFPRDVSPHALRNRHMRLTNILQRHHELFLLQSKAMNVV